MIWLTTCDKNQGMLEASWIDTSEDDEAEPKPAPKFVFKPELVDEFDVIEFDRQQERLANSRKDGMLEENKMQPLSETIVPDSEPDEESNIGAQARLSQSKHQRKRGRLGCDGQSDTTSTVNEEVALPPMGDASGPANIEGIPDGEEDNNIGFGPDSPTFCLEDFLGSQEQ